MMRAQEWTTNEHGVRCRRVYVLYLDGEELGAVYGMDAATAIRSGAETLYGAQVSICEYLQPETLAGFTNESLGAVPEL